MNRLKWVALTGAASLGTTLLGVPKLLSDNDRGWDLERYKAESRVAAADYDTIPLPIKEPPSGAVVDAGGFADPSAYGQQIMFQYQGYTVSACTVDTRTADKDKCSPPAEKVLRTIRSGTYVTNYTASTKFDDPISDPDGARTVEFFKTAALATDPSWMHSYVEREIKEMYGS